MMISIHTLRMEGDALPGHFDDGAAISIHTLRMEGDWQKVTSVAKGAWISIHTLRMEGDRLPVDDTTIKNISIHTLRVEGDSSMKWRNRNAVSNFNPHPPRGG